MLAAALAALPDPTALVAPSTAILLANAAWQTGRSGAALAAATAPVESAAAAEPAAAELAGAALGRLWGMPTETIAAFQAACAELGQAAAGAGASVGTSAGTFERELTWTCPLTPGAAPAHYRLILRALTDSGIGEACILVVLKDVTAAEQLARALLAMKQERDEAIERLSCFAAITAETLVVSERGKILFVNEATVQMFRCSMDEVVGKNLLSFAAPEFHAEIIAHLTKNNSDVPYEAWCIRSDGTRFLAEVRGKMITYHGRPVRGAALLDITERRRVEELLNQKLREEERVRAQSETLFALSTPLLPVSDEVLVVPLIGSLDSRRMARVTEILLSGLSERQSHYVILDITGLPTLDGATALGLVRAAQGARLVGAQTILCGIRAEVAHELVRLGADLSGLLTRSTLKSAIAFALKQTALAPRPAPSVRARR